MALRTALEMPVDERGVVRRLKDHLKFERAGRGSTDSSRSRTRWPQRSSHAAPTPSAPTVSSRAAIPTGSGPTPRSALASREHSGSSPTTSCSCTWLAWYRKGGDLLAGAMRMLEGVRAATYRRLLHRAPDDAVLGSVRRLPVTDRVHEYHQASDIFLSASRSEGFGNGLVEAMACECVAIASVAAGQVETFAGLDGVLAVPVATTRPSPRQFGSLVARREAWPALGEANRAHVLEHHSMRPMGAGHDRRIRRALPCGVRPCGPTGAADPIDASHTEVA